MAQETRWMAVPIRLAAGLAAALAMAGCVGAPAIFESAPAPPGDPLSSGRWIDPARALSSTGVGSMPVNVILSPDGQYALTTGLGYREHVCAVRVSDGKEVGNVDFPTSRTARPNGLYYGLAFGPDGRVYAAMGAAGKVAVLRLGSDGSLALDHEISTGGGANDFPAGIALDEAGRLYVAHNDPVGKDFSGAASVAVYDSVSGKELGRYVFAEELSNFPLAVAVAGGKIYVGSERDAKVYVLDAADPARITLRSELATGSHPLALLLNKARTTLYVANAQSDTVSIVDTRTDRITGTVLLRPQVARDLAGATPTGLALSQDERMLYVTLGDMNAVGVVDLGEAGGARVEGYIPTGWYPTAVAVGGGDQLLIVNGKGDRARIPHDFSQGKAVTSPLYLFEGTLWRVGIPRGEELESLTQECLQNARLTPQYLDGQNPLAGISLRAGKIKHVIYIIKENRTYDHVLGDLAQGNGDPGRCLFPREVTPNQHALAERFVLLDNFYDSGDVSGDGWTWSTQAQANEYTVRNVPYQYSERGRIYDFEGSNNKYPTGGFPALGPDAKPLSDDPRFRGGAEPVTDVAASPGGHLWDLARKQGLSYRNYGCFVTEGTETNGKVIIPDNYPASMGVQPGGRDLGGITDVDFRRFDLDFPDSEGPSLLARQLHDPGYLWSTQAYGQARMASRFSEWKREFDLMLARDPSGAAVPNLMTVRFCTDHTSGAKAGSPTPRCMVADNDFAVGELVDAVSHSAIWNSCAIVIVEDDAQNGPDHVDAHRSTCYIASPWIRRGAIDHTFQNTVSAIRTLESLLNLPPMCQYDAASGVISDWEDGPRNAEPFNAIVPSSAVMKERNPRRAAAASEPAVGATPDRGMPGEDMADRPLSTVEDLAEASAEMDFSKADHAPAELLNRVIWKTVRGAKSEAPATPHAIGVGKAGGGDDDD